MLSQKLIVGIDTGVTTGVAVWDCVNQEFQTVTSMLIHQAMDFIKSLEPALVRVEDARLRKWFGNSGSEKWKGAGSIKRDAKAWEDFLKKEKFPYEMVAPRHNKTKLDAKQFKKETGWMKQTNNHGRDAGMLVFGFTERNLATAINIFKR